MDELAKALAEAIKAGSALAPSALIGYYLVRIVEALAPVLGVTVVAWLAARFSSDLVKRYWDYYTAHPSDKRVEN